uniref:Transcription factor E2F7 n=1 Tax=Cynoglossus semilaevis TaxID=244447 RepID=A0A3P8WPX2_CYNSE
LMEVECLALKDLTSPRKSLSENLCLDWRTPPLKSTESSVAPMLINRKGSTPVVDQVTPIKHSVLAEPWSPTANLKMLISAASPDIRDREMKKIEVAAEATKAGAVHDDDGGEADTGNGNNTKQEVKASRTTGGNRKDKSLRIMSQKFVMLFLVSRTLTVTLDAAAKILIDESQDSSSHSKYKTKVRRLYDIANVLTSLGLIKKVHVREEKGRKPAFRWLGPPMTDRTTGQKVKMTRHSSFNITPTSAAVLRQVYSAPSSPRRDTPAELHRRTTTNSAVCRLQFGTPLSVDPPSLQVHRPQYQSDLHPPSLLLFFCPGLNSLNFFLPSNHPPTSAVPTMALSYVLVPSAALSHYPLVTGGHRQQGPEAHAKLGFSLPTTASSGHCGAAPFTLVSSDYGWSPRPSQSSPDTPQTPKDTTASMSRSFFQTPGTLEGGVNTATPAGRKRGSAQRRLDVGHPPVD